MSAMTISYQITRRDVVEACIAMARKVYWFVFGLWLVLAALFAWMNGTEVRHASALQRLYMLLPLGICGVVFLLMAWISPHYRARRVILREVTWTFSNDGVRLESNVSKADLRWEAFLKYRETPKLFLLFVQKGMAQFIPKRVLTAEQTNNLRMLLTSHVKSS